MPICMCHLAFIFRETSNGELSTDTNTYAMCTKLPRGVIDNIDRIRKQCLWRGNSDKKRGGNLVAWETVQKLKDKGGLGVTNLRLQK